MLEGQKVTGNEKANLEDSLKPSQFDTLVQCARNLGGYSEEDGALANRQFKSPSTAGKCGYSLKRAALILKGEALRDTDMAKLNDITSFLELYEGGWGNKVANPALRNLAFKKHNTPELLPLTNDLLLLRGYLTKEIKVLTPKLQSPLQKKSGSNLH